MNELELDVFLSSLPVRKYLMAYVLYVPKETGEK